MEERGRWAGLLLRQSRKQNKEQRHVRKEERLRKMYCFTLPL